jgi:hypothetical protein
MKKVFRLNPRIRRCLVIEPKDVSRKTIMRFMDLSDKAFVLILVSGPVFHNDS